MNPKVFLTDILGTDVVPEVVETEKALGAISAAIAAATDKASEFDDDKVAPLLSALRSISSLSTDPVAVRAAANAIVQYEDFL